jgi:hypothetical protein
MSTDSPPRLVVDVQHRQQERRPKPPRRPRGRWIWVISGMIMIAALGIPVARVFIRAGNQDYGAISASPVATRVVTITKPVTSLNVQSYGSDIRVIGDPLATTVRVTESLQYNPRPGPAPAVTDTVSDGQLTLAAPACDTSNCSVGFTVTVPSRVSITAVSEGGNVVVQGVTGPAATIITDGGNLTARDMAVQSATLSTNGGDARVRFITAPGNVDVTTGGGNVTMLVPGGPYAITADSQGGLEVVGVATSPAARGSLTVTTGGGSLSILPTSAPAGPAAPQPATRRRSTSAPPSAGSTSPALAASLAVRAWPASPRRT